jgi:3-keto-5-aminohexanoate cleavage enzyme
MSGAIIEAAVNGSTRKRTNPHVPVTAAELVADALACLAAGAAIVHQHDDFSAVTEPGSAGMAALSATVYREVLAAVPDALLYPTANFPAGPSGTDLWAPHERLAAQGLIRMAVFDPGAVTVIGLDRDGVPLPRGAVYGYSGADIAHIAERCRVLGLGPSTAIFEPGHLRTLLAFHRAGRLPPGAFVKLYFGAGRTVFGLPPTERSLEVYLDLLGEAATEIAWGVAVLGGDVVACGLAEAAFARGGHVRVGLEDHRGPRQPTNAELVAEVAALAVRCGRTVASPAEAAAILRLPTAGLSS